MAELSSNVEREADRRRFLIENLSDQGLSPRKIAAALGMTKEAVQRRLKERWRKCEFEQKADAAYRAWCLDAAKSLSNLAQRSREAAYRVRAYGGEVTESVDLYAVIVRDNAICHLCGEPVEADLLVFDHVVPLVHGGTHTTENVRVAHVYCNSEKGARL